MDQHDDSADTGPMAANPADPDAYLDPDPDPMGASPARAGRGGVRSALTSRAAGWVVATLLAGALTGLAVNVATAPSATVVRQVSVVGPARLGLVTPGARCAVIGVRPGGPISIRVIGPGKQVIVRRLTPVKVHAQIAKLAPGVQVPPGVRVPPSVQVLPGVRVPPSVQVLPGAPVFMPGPGARLVCPG